MTVTAIRDDDLPEQPKTAYSSTHMYPGSYPEPFRPWTPPAYSVPARVDEHETVTVEEFDSTGALVKRTTTTTIRKPTDVRTHSPFISSW